MKRLTLLISFLILLLLIVAVGVNFKTFRQFPTQELKQKNETVAETIITDPVPPQFTDKTFFLSAIKQNRTSPSSKIINGITVPHHLLAVDLIAGAFKFASTQKPDTILLLSPDHFNLGKTDVSVSERDFLTVFGEIKTDQTSVKQLEQLPFVTSQNFYYREHGLGAELPFISYYFPTTKIIALTFKETTSKTELQQIITELKKIVTPKTLVVQSTDFSHYLTPTNAAIKDQQTTKVLQSGNAEQLFSLNQPDNLDSLACQYIQLRLQNEIFTSHLSILFHKNSQDYTLDPIKSTTSYIIQAYLK